MLSPESPSWSSWILECTKAAKVGETHLVQPLWGGLGELWRIELTGGPIESAILKCVRASNEQTKSLAEQRKWRSYEIEQRWYERHSPKCGEECRLARWYGSRVQPGELLLLLEDLGSGGYAPQKSPSARQLKSGLEWLARFHARFVGQRPEGLWEQGTYWNLEYRQEELERTTHPWFKTHAWALDRELRNCRFQTVVHGDAKASNFLWRGEDEAAVVDFQWVGPGCGMRDVTLLLDRCLGEERCLEEADSWLDHYLETLHSELIRLEQELPWEALEAEWRRLYPIAWCDHERLWLGWGQGTQSLGPYTQQLMERSGTALGQV